MGSSLPGANAHHQAAPLAYRRDRTSGASARDPNRATDWEQVLDFEELYADLTP